MHVNHRLQVINVPNPHFNLLSYKYFPGIGRNTPRGFRASSKKANEDIPRSVWRSNNHLKPRKATPLSFLALKSCSAFKGKGADFGVLHGEPAAAYEVCVHGQQVRCYNKQTGLKNTQWPRCTSA